MRAKTAIAAVCAALILAACGDDGDPAPASSGTPSSTTSGSAAISGKVIAGPISGTVVKAYALAADGSAGDLLRTSEASDGNGAFTLTLSALPADGNLLLIAAGGSYTSEFDGASITVTSPMRAVITGVTSSGVTGVALSPLSDLLVAPWPQPCLPTSRTVCLTARPMVRR